MSELSSPTTEDFMSLSWKERIRWIAERFEGGSLRALGRRIGVTGQAVSAWARGDTRPSCDALAAIATAYPELSARWLLTGEGAPALGRLFESPPDADEAPSEEAVAEAIPTPTGEDDTSEERTATLRTAREIYRRGWEDALSEVAERVRSLADH